jgi:Tol biopolymer transport system component
VCAVWLAGCSVLPPLPTDHPAARSSVSKIAYTGADDHVYVAEADGSAARRMSEHVSGLSVAEGWTYRWPTYSPDARRLAFAGFRSRTGALTSSAIVAAEVEPARAGVLLESSQLVPIYLYWSPDNRHLSALVQSARTLELHLLDATGSEPPRMLAAGQPLYWSWASDGHTLAVHIGGDAESNPDAWVGLLNTADATASPDRFGDPPGGFRAPAWSPAGDRLAFAALGGGVSLLSVRDARGQVARVASSSGEVAFSWAPDGDWLAFAFSAADSPAIYDGLEVVRPDGSERHRLSQDRHLGFYWAPDGKRLALLGLNSAARQLAWSTVQVDGKGQRQLASFWPTSDFAFQLPFFDQYVQSTSLWSPDGRKLIYAAEGGTEQTNGSTAGERVMVLEVDGQAAPTVVARGGVAVWSPPPPRGR